MFLSVIQSIYFLANFVGKELKGALGLKISFVTNLLRIQEQMVCTNYLLSVLVTG